MLDAPFFKEPLQLEGTRVIDVDEYCYLTYEHGNVSGKGINALIASTSELAQVYLGGCVKCSRLWGMYGSLPLPDTDRLPQRSSGCSPDSVWRA